MAARRPRISRPGSWLGQLRSHQQIAILVGAFASALILGPILLLLNDSATVYVPRRSFEPAAQTVTLDSTRSASLPAYSDPIRPAGAGDYRVLKNEAGASAVAGLDPGEYLVDSSGRVAYKVEENFPATFKIDPSQAGTPEKLKGPQANVDTGYIDHSIRPTRRRSSRTLPGRRSRSPGLSCGSWYQWHSQDPA